MTSLQTPAFTQVDATDLEGQIRALVRESLTHPAVHHPFLTSFASGEYADAFGVMRQYALEYSGYASWFPHYLRSVIRRLERQDHRLLLLRNLEEERGQLDEDDCQALRGVGIDPNAILGIPHPVLFRRFCHAIGLSDQDLSQPTEAAREWRTAFLDYLSQATEAEAVGALGLGTEHIVRPVYEHLLAGIRRIGVLKRDDYVFFELHCLVDDQHQQDLLTIAKELASTRPDGVGELRRGMQKALDLRCEFWNKLAANVDRQRRARIA
ncbi:MAG: iron-containing redox enzyme family protein [Planctomycetes bacterium]|nr:iron-containing redox enzyme family protein [Planctomycetota bacterium]